MFRGGLKEAKMSCQPVKNKIASACKFSSRFLARNPCT